MKRRSVTRDQRGFALFATFLLLLLLGSLAGATLVYSSIDLRSTSHYRTGTEALMAAESGVLHAFHALNWILVTNLGNQVQAGDWSDVTSTWHTMQGDPQSSYRADIVPDPASPGARGWITSVGTSPLGAARGVRVRIERGLFGSAGALYLFNPLLNGFRANGASAFVHGNDCDPDSGYVRPSVTVQNGRAEDVVRAGIGANEYADFQGLGDDPSVFINNDRTMAQIIDMAQTFLSPPNVVHTVSPTHGTNTSINGTSGNDCQYSGPLGNLNEPQITYLGTETGRGRVTLSGNVCGGGILIVRDRFTINGNFTFRGLILAIGEVEGLASGSATIYGSLWAGALDMRVGGNLLIQYCTPALAAAGALVPENTFPTTMQITSWEEDNDLVASVLYSSTSVEAAN